MAAKRKSASAADATANRQPNLGTASAALDFELSASENSSNASSDEEHEAGENEEADGMRHEALLAEVRGAVADRKRKRTVVASEAYPDSEYNLPPTSASAGEQYSTGCI